MVFWPWCKLTTSQSGHYYTWGNRHHPMEWNYSAALMTEFMWVLSFTMMFHSEFILSYDKISHCPACQSTLFISLWLWLFPKLKSPLKAYFQTMEKNNEIRKQLIVIPKRICRLFWKWKGINVLASKSSNLKETKVPLTNLGYVFISIKH